MTINFISCFLFVFILYISTRTHRNFQRKVPKRSNKSEKEDIKFQYIDFSVHFPSEWLTSNLGISCILNRCVVNVISEFHIDILYEVFVAIRTIRHANFFDFINANFLCITFKPNFPSSPKN